MLQDKKIKPKRNFFITIAGIDDSGLIQLISFTINVYLYPSMKDIITHGYTITQNLKDITLVSITEISTNDFKDFMK